MRNLTARDFNLGAALVDMVNAKNTYDEIQRKVVNNIRPYNGGDGIDMAEKARKNYHERLRQYLDALEAWMGVEKDG